MNRAILLMLALLLIHCGDKNSSDSASKKVASVNTHNIFKVIKIDTLNYSTYKRLSVSIEVPNDFTDVKIRAALESAFQSFWNSSLHVIKINAFREHSKNKSGSMFAVGELVYAPNGKWEDANKNEPLKKIISINSANKAGTIKERNIQKQCTVVSDNSGWDSGTQTSIKAFKSKDNWTDENIAFAVKPNSKVDCEKQVIEYLSPKDSIVHYLVMHKNKKGWISGTNIKE